MHGPGGVGERRMLPARLQFCYPGAMTTAADGRGPGILEGQMRALLAAHWPAPDDSGSGEAREPRRRRWFAALDERNWRVAGWPRRFGGEGWDDRALATWHRLCALAGAPLPDPMGCAVVGPLLIEHGTAAQQRELLPGIRLGLGRWHLAGLPGTRAGAVMAVPEPPRSGRAPPHGLLKLRGAVLLSGPAGRDDGLCLVTAAGLALVALADLGGPLSRSGGRLDLDDVAVRPVAWLGDEHSAEDLAWQAQRRFWATAAPAARARRLLRLITALPELRGDGAVTDLHRGLEDLEAALYGVEALTERSLAAPGREDLALLAALRADGLLTRLDALAGAALAYGALPVPPARGDNRPRIGHDSGLPAASDAGTGAALRLQAELEAARRQPALADDLVRDRLARAR